MAKYNELIEYIDNIVLHEKEYDVIKLLLDNSDPRFFTKILEEVVDGNIFWIDFYPILDIPEYRSQLKNTFESQKELAYNIKNFTEYRKKLGMNIDNNIGFVKGDTDHDSLSKDDYENRLFNLLQVAANDNIFSVTCKTAIYNAIENYKYATNPNNKDASFNNFGELIYDAKYFDYLDPKDILFSQDDIILPIEYQYQEITNSDRDFMAEHNITDIEMKKIKALTLFIKKNNNTGG